jgi:DNA-binding CsgD family transcriptional regulator
MLAIESVADSTWRERFSGQLNAFARVGRGAMVVDELGRVLGLNACVQLGDGLHVSAGVLQTSRSNDRPRLQEFLSGIKSRAASRQPNEPTRSAPIMLTLPRPSGRRPWLLDAIDLSDNAKGPQGRAAALLLITDVEQPSRLSIELLDQVFGLTATEARVAIELASGKSLQEVSVRLDISEGHARQRLKSVFCKTRTSRQGELIALLAKLG